MIRDFGRAGHSGEQLGGQVDRVAPSEGCSVQQGFVNCAELDLMTFRGSSSSNNVP